MYYKFKLIIYENILIIFPHQELYECNERPHLPTYADEVNWLDVNVIKESSRIYPWTAITNQSSTYNEDQIKFAEIF